MLLIADVENARNLHTIGCKRTSRISWIHLLWFYLISLWRCPLLEHRFRYTIVLSVNIHHDVAGILHGVEASLRVIWRPLSLLESARTKRSPFSACWVKWQIDNLLVSFTYIGNIVLHYLTCVLELLIKISRLLFINSKLVAHERAVIIGVCMVSIMQYVLLLNGMWCWRWCNDSTVFEWGLAHRKRNPIIVMVSWMRGCSFAASTANTEGRVHHISLSLLLFNFPYNWSALLLIWITFELGYALV